MSVLSYNRPRLPGPSCVLSDLRMPELDRLELQQRLSRLGDAPMLLMSSSSTLNEDVSAFRQGEGERKSRVLATIASLTDEEQQIARAVAPGCRSPQTWASANAPPSDIVIPFLKRSAPKTPPSLFGSPSKAGFNGA